MPNFKVRLINNGVLGDEPQDVVARSEKEAAEKLHGGILFKQGRRERMRAMVTIPGLESTILYYERLS
jgi:hypothetical protein